MRRLRSIHLVCIALGSMVLLSVATVGSAAARNKSGIKLVEICHQDPVATVGRFIGKNKSGKKRASDGGYMVIKVPMRTAMKHVLDHGDFENFEILDDGSCGPAEPPQCLCAEFWSDFPQNVGSVVTSTTLSNCDTVQAYQYDRTNPPPAPPTSRFLSVHTANGSLFCNTASNGNGSHIGFTSPDPQAEIQACRRYVEAVSTVITSCQ